MSFRRAWSGWICWTLWKPELALQYIISDSTQAAIEHVLGFLSHLEVFEIDALLIGVSIPTKDVDAFGEDLIAEAIANFKHYDLFRGTWSEPPPQGHTQRKHIWFWTPKR